MLVFKEYQEWPKDTERSCVAIGNFDGVHHGHRLILDQALEVSRRNNLVPTVMTFDPHPRRLFRPETAPALIEPLEVRLERLNNLGFQQVLVQEFDATFASLTAERFVNAVLLEALNARHIVVGRDFRFGKARSGTTEALKQMLQAAGGDADLMPELRAADGEVVSSTVVRKAIEQGDVETATKLLGRPPEWQGSIVRGDGRGKGLGFATANLNYSNEIKPALGVYAGIASLQSKRYGCVVNVGINPTFEEHGPVKFEAHLFGYSGPDVYDELFRVKLISRIREERKFERLEDLIAQVHADAQKAKNIIQALDTPL